jgi:hypothetical protein
LISAAGVKSGTVEVRLEDGEVRDVPAAEWTAEALDEHIAIELIFAHYDDIGIDARAPQRSTTRRPVSSSSRAR